MAKRDKGAKHQDRSSQPLTNGRQQPAKSGSLLQPAAGATQVFVQNDDLRETQLPRALS